MSRHVDPAGGRGGAYPSSMKLKCIRDTAIIALLEDEKRLRAELNDAKVEQRKVADAKDANLRVFQPASDTFNSTVMNEIDKVQLERSAVADKIDVLRETQRTFGQKRDRVKQLDFELDAPEFRKDLLALTRQVEGTAAGAANLEALKKKLDARVAEKLTKEKERKALRDELADAGDVSQKFTQAKKQLQDINDKLDTLFAKKRSQKPQNKELDGINKQLTESRTRRDALAEELDAVMKKLAFTRFEFPPAFRGDLLGKQGATLAQLQEDFGVAINIDTAGHGTGGKSLALLVGGQEDVDACIEAMRSIVDNAERTRQQLTMKFDPVHSKALIGSKGSNVDRMQLTTGANIKIKDDEITLTGTTEAIEAAKALIEEVISNGARVEIPFDRNILDSIIGKGGATVRKVEQESGAKSVRVLRVESMIVISGTEASVAKAAAMFREIIENMSTNAVTVRADTNMIRAVIGTGGKTIREIQDSTGAIINCGKDVITIRGSKDAVALAKRQIEDVGRREEAKVTIPSFMYGYLTAPNVETTATTTSSPTTAAAPQEEAAEDDGEEGETAATTDEKKKPTAALLSPLDAIKQVTKCDQVVALQREGVVILRGRREAVQKARALLDDILRTKRPVTASIAIPDVLFGFFTKRSGGGKAPNVLTQLKTKYPHIYSFDLDRPASTVVIAAPQSATSDSDPASPIQEAIAAVKDIISSVQGNIRKIEIPAGRAGAVIGSGGKVIGGIQSSTHTDITVHKEQNIVWVFHESGDVAALDAAVAAVEEAAGMTPPAASE